MPGQLNIVVIGEVDTGKSTLLGRFLYEIGSLSTGAIDEVKRVCQELGHNFEFAYLLDSFEEERRNQLTIDTTQVFCKTKKDRKFVFIDVPGHQELLKNMLCGSSYADLAIWVIDAQKQIGEQAKRQLWILKLLGIEQIIVALNKMDAVGFSKSAFAETKEKTSRFLRNTEIQPQYFIPISAKQGDNLVKKSKNMPWYKGLLLLEALNAGFKKEESKALRFLIQDIYKVNKDTIAVGRIISGKIRKREKVNILPLHKESRVKIIKVFPKNKSVSYAPESIGLMLEDMDGLRRGQVICKPKLPNVNTEILTKVFCVRPLNIKENLKFRCATQETPAQIRQINRIYNSASLEPKSKQGVLEERDFAEVIIRTENPMAVERFEGSNSLGRFVLENNKEIYAVGVIL